MILYHASPVIVERPNAQLCIRTQIVLDECLHYLGSEKQ